MGYIIYSGKEDSELYWLLRGPFVWATDGNDLILVFNLIFNGKQIKTHKSPLVLKVNANLVIRSKALSSWLSIGSFVVLSYRINDKSIIPILIL